jgi:nitroreductase
MFALLFVSALSDLPDIKLNSPDLTRGLAYGQALSKRHSERTFASTPLSLQDLSDLFWAVGGINRPDIGYLVCPTAVNAQDIRIYAVLPQGIYSYDKQAHVLHGVVEGDYRNDVATDEQPTIANAPVIVLIASDQDAFVLMEQDEKIHLGALDAGIVSQTALLWAAANGFIAVPRAIMDTDKLASVLNLKSTEILELNVPIGYAP